MLVAFTQQIDMAQLAVLVFGLFFAGLVFYLRREDKREGYPLDDPGGGRPLVGFPLPPPEKTYRRIDGGSVTLPNEHERGGLPLLPRHRPPGSPLVPIGSGLAAGIGPASWVMRDDEPIRMNETEIQILPMRDAAGWHVVGDDPDPRGMPVLGADGRIAGTVRDLWVDRSVKILRYLEVALVGPETGHVLLPIYFADVSARRRQVRVRALLAKQIAAVPRLRDPDRITAREEDQVCAFYAGGALYARPERSEALL